VAETAAGAVVSRYYFESWQMLITIFHISGYSGGNSGGGGGKQILFRKLASAHYNIFLFQGTVVETAEAVVVSRYCFESWQVLIIIFFISGYSGGNSGGGGGKQILF
jgi:hypothetical protein